MKPLAVVSVIMFLGNMAVMRLFFGINVLGVMTPPVVNVPERDRLPERGELLNSEETLNSEGRLNAEGTLKQELPMQKAQKDEEHKSVSYDPIAVLQHLSLPDKLFVLSLLPKIGREGMDRLIELTNDGLAFDEYEEIKKLAENSLIPSDIEKLKEIFNKNKGLFARNFGE